MSLCNRHRRARYDDKSWEEFYDYCYDCGREDEREAIETIISETWRREDLSTWRPEEVDLMAQLIERIHARGEQSKPGDAS